MVTTVPCWLPALALSPTSSAIRDPSAFINHLQKLSLLLRRKQSPSTRAALPVSEEQVLAESGWRINVLISRNELSRAARPGTGFPAGDSGSTTAEHGKGARDPTSFLQTAFGYLLFLLGDGFPFSHRLCPRGVLTPGTGRLELSQLLGTDAFTKTTFLAGSSCASHCCWAASCRLICYCFLTPSEPNAAGK